MLEATYRDSTVVVVVVLKCLLSVLIPSEHPNMHKKKVLLKDIYQKKLCIRSSNTSHIMQRQKITLSDLCKVLVEQVETSKAWNVLVFLQKINWKNELCKYPKDVTIVMHNFLATVMVLGLMSNEEDVIPSHFFPQSLWVNTDYYKMLERFVRPWIWECKQKKNIHLPSRPCVIS